MNDDEHTRVLRSPVPEAQFQRYYSINGNILTFLWRYVWRMQDAGTVSVWFYSLKLQYIRGIFQGINKAALYYGLQYAYDDDDSLKMAIMGTAMMIDMMAS